MFSLLEVPYVSFQTETVDMERSSFINIILVVVPNLSGSSMWSYDEAVHLESKDNRALHRIQVFGPIVVL